MRAAPGTLQCSGRQAVCHGRAAHQGGSASSLCWPRKAFIKRPGIVDVSIGKPIPSEGREADELMREVEAWIEAEMRRLDPEAYTKETALH
jgi:1-acyl-sn-glycerol-3-phosphate acyltransferase